MKRESFLLDALGLLAEIIGLEALFLVIFINAHGHFLSYHYSEACQYAFLLLSLLGLACYGEIKIRRNEFVSLPFRILHYVAFAVILPNIILIGLLWQGNMMAWYYYPASAVAVAMFLLTLISDLMRIGHGYDRMVEQVNKEALRGERRLGWLPLLAEFLCFGLLCFAASGPLLSLPIFADINTRPIFFYASVAGTFLFVPFFIIRIKSRASSSFAMRLISYLPPLACLAFAVISLNQNLFGDSERFLPFFLPLLSLSPISLIAMLSIDIPRLGGRRKAVAAIK